MARGHQLDPIMERWAIWCQDGGILPGYRSIMNEMINNHGVMVFGSGGGRDPRVDCIEAEIEAIIAKLAQLDLKTVEVLRTQYNVRNVRRLYDANQSEKALFMGISLRTYTSRLKMGRDFILMNLTRK